MREADGSIDLLALIPEPADSPAEAETSEPELGLAEMESRLLDAIELGDEALDDLARARFETVHRFITASGEVPESRVVASPR